MPSFESMFKSTSLPFEPWRGLTASQTLLVTLLALLAALSWPRAAAADGSEVVILYSRQKPESRAVAEHYARARNVPENQWIGLDTTSDNAITHAEYVAKVQKPILETLSERGLLTYTNFISAATNGHRGGPAIRVTGAKVRYLVLCWGLPYRIIHDPLLNGELPKEAPAAIRRNDASIDSELSLLPSAGGYRLVAGLDNPLYKHIDRSHFHPTNGIIMVGRLDGPTPEIARGLVDKALSCETNGFGGNAYFDLRNITSGTYRTGDEWLTNAAAACRKVGLPTHVENSPATFPSTFPMSQIGVYMGWYAGSVDGPFTLPQVEFMPGAIAYHLHSFNGTQPRNPNTQWVGPLLAKGATVTFGSVDEPFLEFTPNVHVFMELLATGGFTIGEAAIASQPWLSWMNVFYGDPLFVPFQQNLNKQETEQIARRSPTVDWTVLRKVNIFLANPNEPSAIRESLIRHPPTTNSAILSEKVASMFADANQLRSAILWARRTLGNNPSPQQRVRILLNLAEWLDLTRQSADAVKALREVEELRPDYANLIPFRERQLALARDAGDTAELNRIKAELKRLREPPPAPTPPASPTPAPGTPPKS
jgi:uncharacterized protein (TIGR03790 family)